VKILMVNYTLGFHGGTEEMVDLMEKEFKSLGSSVKSLNSKDPFYLYLRTRQYQSWADIINVFNFPASLGTFPTCSKPVVWCCYDLPEEYSRWWKVPFETLNRQMMRRPGKYVVVISKLDAKRFERLYRRQVDYIIPLGVDWNFFSEKPKERDNASLSYKILQVGAVGKFKNQLEGVSIFKEFQKVVPHSKLIIVGSKILAGSGPQYWESVLDKIRKEDLQGKVVMTGGLSREELRAYYHSSDILLHPVSESTGTITLFEALSAGLPIVTSKNFVRKDFLNGFGIATDSYLRALMEVYFNRDKYKDMAKRGSEWVKSNLTGELYSRKIYKIFEEVLKYEKTYKRWWMRDTVEVI